MSAGANAAGQGGKTIGGLLTAWGTLQAGVAEQRASEMNADQAEQNALLSAQKGVEDSRRLRVQGSKALGDIRTSYAASGVTAEGSVLDVLKESAANVEHDAQTAKFNGDAKAVAYRNEARIDRYRGDNAERAADISASASLIDSGATAAGA